MCVSCSDDHGFSPLHWACREGRSSVVDMLIMRGARINVMNRGDDTPLHLAASHGHRDILAKVEKALECNTRCTLDCFFKSCFFFQLIQCKADPNTVNEHGNTPLHYACFWGQDEVAEVECLSHNHSHSCFRVTLPSSGGKGASVSSISVFYRTWWPVALKSACVTAMDRHLWTRPSFIYDSCSKVRGQ